MPDSACGVEWLGDVDNFVIKSLPKNAFMRLIYAYK